MLECVSRKIIFVGQFSSNAVLRAAWHVKCATCHRRPKNADLTPRNGETLRRSSAPVQTCRYRLRTIEALPQEKNERPYDESDPQTKSNRISRRPLISDLDRPTSSCSQPSSEETRS